MLLRHSHNSGRRCYHRHCRRLTAEQYPNAGQQRDCRAVSRARSDHTDHADYTDNAEQHSGRKCNHRTRTLGNRSGCNTTRNHRHRTISCAGNRNPGEHHGSSDRAAHHRGKRKQLNKRTSRNGFYSRCGSFYILCIFDFAQPRNCADGVCTICRDAISKICFHTPDGAGNSPVQSVRPFLMRQGLCPSALHGQSAVCHSRI